jgi:hypothetical protein
MLTGEVPPAAQAGDVRVLTIKTFAGVTAAVLPKVESETVKGEAVKDLLARLAKACPDFPDTDTVLYAAPDSAQLQEVPPAAAVAALGTDIFFVVRKKAHEKKTTGIKNEYERGDIDCPRCKKKGPSRYTGHESCTECKCCGTCCIVFDRCGVPAGLAAPDLTQAQKDGQEEYLKEFYKWQRGIMKPY